MRHWIFLLTAASLAWAQNDESVVLRTRDGAGAEQKRMIFEGQGPGSTGPALIRIENARIIHAASAGDMDLGAKKIVNLGWPADPADAATKGYVDYVVSSSAAGWSSAGGTITTSQSVGIGTSSIPAGTKLLVLGGSIQTDKPIVSTVPTGTAPLTVSSTTTVLNLSADYLRGYAPGNASGNIPISNGVLNLGLNADLLDGLTSAAFGQLAASQTWSGVNVFSNSANRFTGAELNLTGAVKLTRPTAPTGLWNLQINGSGHFELRDNQGFDAFSAGDPNSDYRTSPFIVERDAPTGSLVVRTATVSGSNNNVERGTVTLGPATAWDKNTGSYRTVPVDLVVSGTISKAGGTFDIEHPDPAKARDGWRLRHSFVESPTRGDNLYRWSVQVRNGRATIELPEYFCHLNENVQIWVSPADHFGRACGTVDAGLKRVTIKADSDGTYNVLVIGTRKDPAAKRFDERGVEYRSEGTK